MSTDTAQTPMLHTYECIHCHTWARSPVDSRNFRPLRCLCGAWLRWRSTGAAVTDEDRALLTRKLSFFWPRAVLNGAVPTKTCANKACRKATPLPELVNGKFCSYACEEVDAKELEELKARVEHLYQTRPWLRPMVTE